MKEKTFEELITEKFPNYRFADKHDWNMRKFSGTDMIEMMKQVREATNEEWCQAFLGVTLPAEAVKKIGAIITHTNRIKTDL